MLLEKINRFWKAGLIQKNKKAPLFVMIMRMLLILAGCSGRTTEVSDIEIIQQDREVYFFDKTDQRRCVD